MSIPKLTQERKQHLCSLMNVRTAKPVKNSLLEVQDGTSGKTGGTSGNTKSVKTGDDARPEFYLALLLIGGIVLIAYMAKGYQGIRGVSETGQK